MFDSVCALDTPSLHYTTSPRCSHYLKVPAVQVRQHNMRSGAPVSAAQITLFVCLLCERVCL